MKKESNHAAAKQVVKAAERYNGTPVSPEDPYKAGLTLVVRAASEEASPSETLVEFDSFENAERFAEYAECNSERFEMRCEFAESPYEWSL